MDDPLFVGLLERRGDLVRDVESFFDRNGTTRDALGKGLTRDELEHEVVGVVGVLEPIDRGDVRMVERRENLGFALESSQPLRVLSELLGQDLDGDVTPELRVPSSIHLTRYNEMELDQGIVFHKRKRNRKTVEKWKNDSTERQKGGGGM